MADAFRDLGVFVTAALAVWAAWRTYRKDTSSEVRADFDSLRDELRKQLQDERAENEQERERNRELEKRVSALEAGLLAERRQRELAVEYVGTLIACLRETGATIPDPPEGLEVSWTT